MQAHARVPAARCALPRPARCPSRLRAGGTIIPPSRLGNNNCRRTRFPAASVVRASAGDQESTPRDVSAGAQPRDVSASAVVTSDVGTASYDVRMPSYARTGKNFLNISIPTLLNAAETHRTHARVSAMFNIVTAAPNQAVIVSGLRGQRVVIGGCASVMWCVETYDRLYLDLMTLSIKSVEAETAKGVRISLSSTAQIKIMSGDGHKIDYDKVKLAATHFLGKKRLDIQDAVHRTMEGHQRQVIGTLTVEELYKDRASFSERVKELVDPDLLGMGFALVSYTVTEVDDREGYITALGATQTASVKREAEEGKAKNESQARIIVAKAKAEAQIAEAEAKRTSTVRANEFAASEAESMRDLQMKQQGFQKEVNEATARAEAAIRIETAIQNQKVVKQQTLQKVEEAEVMLQVTEREMERAKAEAEGASGAKLIEQKNNAESRRVAAEAEAYEKQQLGEAEAAAIKAKGNAEAAVIREKQQAYPNYAEERMVTIITEKLPAIADAVAAPLKNAGKMTFVSSDGSAGSRLTNDISSIMGQLPDTVEALTGVNLKRVMKRLEGPAAAAVKAAVESTD